MTDISLNTVSPQVLSSEFSSDNANKRGRARVLSDCNPDNVDCFTLEIASAWLAASAELSPKEKASSLARLLACVCTHCKCCASGSE